MPDIPGLTNYATLDYSTLLEIANGTDYDNADVIYYNDDWNDGHGNDGILIRVDRMDPASPSISDEDSKFVGIDVTSVLPSNLEDLGINANSERKWYTSGYNIAINVNFPEQLIRKFKENILQVIRHHLVANITFQQVSELHFIGILVHTEI